MNVMDHQHGIVQVVAGSSETGNSEVACDTIYLRLSTHSIATAVRHLQRESRRLAYVIGRTTP